MASSTSTQGGIKLFGTFISNVNLNQQQKQQAAKPKNIKNPRLPPPINPKLPNDFLDLITSKGADVGSLKLVLSRRLTATNMNRHHNRLSMPQGQIIHNFLNPVEEELIRETRVAGKRNRCNGIQVRVVGLEKIERTMRLVRWNKAKKDDPNENKSWWYALTQKWITVAHENGLVEGDVVHVWSFRFKVNARLGFVMHKVQESHNPKRIKFEYNLMFQDQ